MTMNIALIGYGKMGKELELIAAERAINIVRIFTEKENRDGKALTKTSLKNVDVCIEFSTPDAVMKNIKAAVSCGKNMVVGTTGWYGRIKEVEAMVKKHKSGFLYAANFSPGVNIFSQIVSDAARLFNKQSGYDAAISEVHHRGKADSPSGTALSLGSLIMQQMKRKSTLLTETTHGQIKPHQLHISSTRIGNVTGRHEVVFDSEADTITLVHTAKNRRGYALGALLAAEWLKGKKGFYTMRDVIA